MILKQFYLDCLAQASYLIADPKSGVAAVVDPRRDVDEYVAEAEAHGCKIRHVLLTHFHADFVSGHLELAEREGAQIHIGARAQAEFEFTPMSDGGELLLGSVRLRFLETPGHTPESCCILVFDVDENPEEPYAVLTGDTLFVGDVGRPDLMASVGITANELATHHYASLHNKLLPLPDATRVYPGHGPGSACGRSMSQETWSTMGAQRRDNPALQPMDVTAFVERATDDLPPAPPYFAFDADFNRRKHETLERALERQLKSLSLDEVLSLAETGVQVLDVRGPEEFAAGHLAGSLNIGLGGKFASWAGSVLDRETPMVIVAPPGKEREAVLRLGRIGFDGVYGYLEGGADAWSARQEVVGRLERLEPEELASELAGGAAPIVLDVRTPSERAAGHIDGSAFLPLMELPRRLSEAPDGERVVVVCAGGYRSAIAASLLMRAGRKGLVDLRGGMGAWERVGAS